MTEDKCTLSEMEKAVLDAHDKLSNGEGLSFFNIFKEGMLYGRSDVLKPADGDDLPEIDREVIALVENNEHYVACFAHRPNPNGWDGKSLTTGKVEHFTPKTYDKGGWNSPNIKWWLDVEVPEWTDTGLPKVQTDVTAWSEEQSEPKNNEVPFKKDDWVISNSDNPNRIIMKITSITEDGYTAEDRWGNTSKGSILHLKGNYHLWTINDAEEGDVLCSYDNQEPSVIFIFEKYDDDYKYYYYHCGLNKHLFFLTKELLNDYIYSPEREVYPATCLQYNTLYNKMKENGYRWDDTAKELKRMKAIYFCVDEESESIHIIRFKNNVNDVNVCFTYEDTENALKRGDKVIVTTSLAHFTFDLISKGYDIYLCYQYKEIKIEPHMDLSGIGEPGKDLRCGHNIFKLFKAGIFNPLLGIE